MVTEFVHVQFGNHLAINRVVAMLTPTSAPAKRLIQEYKSKGLLLDMTNGRPRQAILIMDTGHAVLAAVTPETIAARLAGSRPGQPNRVGHSS